MNRPFVTFLNVAADWKSSPLIPITSVEQLKTALGDLLKHEPGVVNLESSTKDLLQLGIGGPFAFAQFTTHDENPRCLCAKANTTRATTYVEFLCGGTPSPISPELCLSFEEAVKIAEYFFKTGDRDLNFEWVDV